MTYPQTPAAEEAVPISKVSAAHGPGNAGPSSLDSLETSTDSKQSTYRDFLTSGIAKQDRILYEHHKAWDYQTGQNRAGRYSACKQSAFFAVNRNTQRVKVFGSSCKLRWCPLCSRSRRYIITNSTLVWMERKQNLRLITLTLEHTSAPLHNQIDALYSSFKRLRAQKLWKSKVKGGIWFFQVKKSSKDYSWHPHIHILAEGKYIDQGELSDAWRKASKGSYIVDIRKVKNNENTAQYVARYAAAPADLTKYCEQDALEVMNALHDRRLCSAFGTAKGIPLKPDKCNDIDDWVFLKSWTAVKWTLKNNKVSAKLWDCWLHDKKFEWDTQFLVKTKPESYELPKFENPKSFKQLFFEYFEMR